MDQNPMISWCFFPTVAFIVIVLKIFIYHVNLIETTFLLQNYIWITAIDKIVLHADYESLRTIFCKTYLTTQKQLLLLSFYI